MEKSWYGQNGTASSFSLGEGYSRLVVRLDQSFTVDDYAPQFDCRFSYVFWTWSFSPTLVSSFLGFRRFFSCLLWVCLGFLIVFFSHSSSSTRFPVRGASVLQGSIPEAQVLDVASRRSVQTEFLVSLRFPGRTIHWRLLPFRVSWKLISRSLRCPRRLDSKQCLLSRPQGSRKLIIQLVAHSGQRNLRESLDFHPQEFSVRATGPPETSR